MMTLSVAPGIHMPIYRMVLVKEESISCIGTYLERQECQQPRILLRKGRAGREDHPFVLQMNPEEGPTLLYSPLSSSYLQRRYPLKTK